MARIRVEISAATRDSLRKMNDALKKAAKEAAAAAFELRIIDEMTQRLIREQAERPERNLLNLFTFNPEAEGPFAGFATGAPVDAKPTQSSFWTARANEPVEIAAIAVEAFEIMPSGARRLIAGDLYLKDERET